MSSDDKIVNFDSKISSTCGGSHSSSIDIDDEFPWNDSLTYDTSAEPLATPEKHAEYERIRAQQEQEQELSARFLGE